MVVPGVKYDTHVHTRTDMCTANWSYYTWPLTICLNVQFCRQLLDLDVDLDHNTITIVT